MPGPEAEGLQVDAGGRPPHRLEPAGIARRAHPPRLRPNRRPRIGPTRGSGWPAPWPDDADPHGSHEIGVLTSVGRPFRGIARVRPSAEGAVHLPLRVDRHDMRALPAPEPTIRASPDADDPSEGTVTTATPNPGSEET